MVGLGETREELSQAFRDLRAVDCDILTLGQYLRPTPAHLPVERYVHPDEFAEMKAEGLALGFKHVESGPLVRSSYHARDQVPEEARRQRSARSAALAANGLADRGLTGQGRRPWARADAWPTRASTRDMHETADDLARLQALLDRSYESAGRHLRSVITPERRLSAADLARPTAGHVPARAGHRDT